MTTSDSTLNILDSLIDALQTKSTESIINQTLSSNASLWKGIMSGLTPQSMKEESMRKYELNKKESNVCKRMRFIQTLFDEYQIKQNGIQRTDRLSVRNDGNDIYEPIEDTIKMNEGVCKKINEGCFTIGSCAGLSVQCGFALFSQFGGRWYYELQLLSNPNDYDLFNVGFANDYHSAKDLGFDGESFGYNLSNNTLCHIDIALHEYGDNVAWTKGDVLGCALDLLNNNIEYYMNGISLGVAFENIEYFGDVLHFGLSLMNEESVTLIYQHNKCQFKENIAQCEEYQAISTHVGQEDWDLDGMFTLKKVAKGVEIVSNDTFPTCYLQKVDMNKGGKYYFEIEMNSYGSTAMQIGVCDAKFQSSSEQGRGVGDDNHSWSIDLHRKTKFGVIPTAYNSDVIWNKGDVVGCMLDFDMKHIEYFKNGKSLGIAFRNVSHQELYPAVSIQNTKAAQDLMEFIEGQELGHCDAGCCEHDHKCCDDDKCDANGAEDIDDYDKLMQYIEKIKSPPIISYGNVILNKNEMRYKQNVGMDCNAIMDNIAHTMKTICDSLKGYSYEQYKLDYAYNKSVVEVESVEEWKNMMKSAEDDTLVIVNFYSESYYCELEYYDELSTMLGGNALFLSANMDKIQDVRQMPSIQLFRNQSKLEELEWDNIETNDIMDVLLKLVLKWITT